ncbi:MAG: hypothetical protein KAX20_01905 [Candidatus Omnitrophica bacterium]|nr:hypothetical protein [Candidatus Omnitrophota bacterium]
MWLEELKKLKDPRTLFQDEKLAKATIFAFALLNFKSYRLEKVKVNGNEASVAVKILQMEQILEKGESKENNGN